MSLSEVGGGVVWHERLVSILCTIGLCPYNACDTEAHPTVLRFRCTLVFPNAVTIAWEAQLQRNEHLQICEKRELQLATSDWMHIYK